MYAHVPTLLSSSSFFFNDTATTEIYTLSLHDALPISDGGAWAPAAATWGGEPAAPVSLKPAICNRFSSGGRSEEHTSELQSLRHLVCRLLLEKKKTKKHTTCSKSKEARCQLVMNPYNR